LVAIEAAGVSVDAAVVDFDASVALVVKLVSVDAPEVVVAITTSSSSISKAENLL
jgi:hypothetical protein